VCRNNSIVTVHGEVLHNEEYHHELKIRDSCWSTSGRNRRRLGRDVTRTWPVSGATRPRNGTLPSGSLYPATGDRAVRPGVPFPELHFLAGRLIAEGLVNLGVLRGDPAEL